MEFDYLELLTLKACLEFTETNSETLNLQYLVNKLNIAIDVLLKNDKKAVLKYE